MESHADEMVSIHFVSSRQSGDSFVNPYESNATLESLAEPHESAVRGLKDPSAENIRKWLVRATWAYPVIFIACLYGTWLIAWVALGYPPRPSLDDPSSISWVVNLFYYPTGLLMAGAPGAVFLGIAIQLCNPARSISGRGTMAMGLIAFWALIFVFVRLDPWQVMNWFMD